MSSASVVAAFRKLLPKNFLRASPQSLRTSTKYYHDTRDGVGQRVFQTRWTSKGIADCYWTVTRTSSSRVAATAKPGVASCGEERT
ncbi:hypothetical protein EI94DRAFT_1197251 [Lactarius quietus]|nr:hypothetical protein EI94DRAFT_1197251 [Lactarius quietus]